MFPSKTEIKEVKVALANRVDKASMIMALSNEVFELIAMI